MLRLSTGTDGLDRMIRGGYLAGSSSIIAGPSGTGKTTLGLQFLSQSTPEMPGLLFGFYETTTRILNKARSIGIDVDGPSPAENLSDKLGQRLLDACPEVFHITGTGVRFGGNEATDLRPSGSVGGHAPNRKAWLAKVQ